MFLFCFESVSVVVSTHDYLFIASITDHSQFFSMRFQYLDQSVEKKK